MNIRITLSKTTTGKNTFDQKKIVLTEQQWNSLQRAVECIGMFAWTGSKKQTVGDVTVEIIKPRVTKVEPQP